MTNVFDPVCRHAATDPTHIAIRGEQSVWTYEHLRLAALDFAGRLDNAHVSPGDRVLLLAPSVPEFVIAYFGVQAIGAVVVPVNTMSTRTEIEYVIADAGCTLALSWHGSGTAADEAATEAGIPAWTLDTADPGTHSGSTQVRGGALDSTAAILYTSGTTGRPKGTQLTVGNLLAGGEIGMHSCRGTTQDRTGTGLPLFHVFGQAAVMMAAFTGGGSLSLLPRFDGAAMLDMLRRDRLTVMAGVPTMWNAMLQAAGNASPRDFSELRVAVSGGASLPGEIARKFEERFGCTILEGYGLTETTAFGTFNSLDRTAKIGYTGTPAALTEVEVRDADGKQCASGEVGEVFIKGDTVMKGYWQRPADTSAVLSDDGWFRTGDLGEFDDDGDLRIVDRLKDLIIRGGYNVYPGEVEEVLYTHPDVVEAAVVGVPDEHYGEEVAAVVTTREGATLTAAELESWTRERLSAYKVPRIVRFVDALPKGSTGKILKRSIDRRTLRDDNDDTPRRVNA